MLLTLLAFEYRTSPHGCAGCAVLEFGLFGVKLQEAHQDGCNLRAGRGGLRVQASKAPSPI